MTCPKGTNAALRRAVLAVLVFSVLSMTSVMHFFSGQMPQSQMTTATVKLAHNYSSSTLGGVVKHGTNGNGNYTGTTQNTTKLSPVRLDTSKLPILVMGMPKSGTSSVNYYFRDCGGQRSSHMGCCRLGSIGLAMRDNARNGRKPLHGMYPEHVDVFTQMDNPMPRNNSFFFPQVELLEEIHAAYPNATFILNTRNVSDWVSSVSRWNGMAKRIELCNITGFPPADRGSLHERLALFYEWHIRRVQEFVESHPSHQLVKFDIYAKDAGTILREAFGIGEICWGQHNVNPRNGKASNAR